MWRGNNPHDLKHHLGRISAFLACDSGLTGVKSGSSGIFAGLNLLNCNYKGAITIARRPHAAQPPKQDGPRINEMIAVDTVRLIDAEGENHGEVAISKALDMAADAGLDLVEISPNASPPVAKILDYGKFKYQAQKKAAEARKNQKTVDVKEVKMRPNIDSHDYEVKLKNVTRFIEAGDKVKMTIRFRGRELAHQELGMQLLRKVEADMGEAVKVEAHPKMEGRQMIMVLAPK